MGSAPIVTRTWASFIKIRVHPDNSIRLVGLSDRRLSHANSSSAQPSAPANAASSASLIVDGLEDTGNIRVPVVPLAIVIKSDQFCGFFRATPVTVAPHFNRCCSGPKAEVAPRTMKTSRRSGTPPRSDYAQCRSRPGSRADLRPLLSSEERVALEIGTSYGTTTFLSEAAARD